MEPVQTVPQRPVVRLGDDHSPWSRTPARGRQPRGGCCHLALPPASVPTAQPPATGAPHARPGLAGRSAGKGGRRGPHPDPADRVRHRPPTDLRDVVGGARVPASATVARAVDGPAATGASTGSGGQGRPATSTRSPPPPPEGRRRTRPDRRLDTGRLDTAWVDTGRLDTGRLDTGRVDSRRPSAGPAGRRPQVSGQRTAGQPDPGRRDRMGGHRLLDSGDRRRGVPAGRVDHGEDARALDGGWTLLWADAVWGEQSPGPLGSKDAEAPTLPRMGLAAAATVSCRWDAAVPLAPWRTAVLGRFRAESRSDGGGSSVMPSRTAVGSTMSRCTTEGEPSERGSAGVSLTRSDEEMAELNRLLAKGPSEPDEKLL